MTEPSEQPPTTPMPGPPGSPPPPGTPPPQWQPDSQPPSPAGPPVFSPGAAQVSYPSYPSYQDQTQGYPYGPSAYPPPPVYPAPPKRRRTGLIVSLVLVFVLLVIGGAAAGGYLLLKDRVGGTEAATTPSASGAPQGTSNPSPTAKPFDGDLRDLLLPEPSGARDPAEPLSTNGRLTASQVAARYQDPNAMLEILEARKFQQGAVSEYRVGDDLGVTIELLQFGDQAKANAAVADLQFAYGRDPHIQEKKFIDGISLGQVYLFKKDKNSPFVLSIAVFSKGDIFCEISVFEKRGAPSDERITKLAQDQFAKLP